MKRIILLIVFTQIILFSETPNYHYAVLSDDTSRAESLNNEKGQLSHIIDLRLLNKFQLENNNNYDNLLNLYINNEKDLNFKDRFFIYEFIRNERILLTGSNFEWAFKNLDELKENLKTLENNDFDNLKLPNITIYGGIYYYYSSLNNRIDINKKLYDELKNREIYIGEFVKAENGYVIPVKDSKYNETIIIFYAYRFNKSIFSNLNNKFIISSVFYPGGEISIEQYASFEGMTDELSLLYGLTEVYGYFKEGNTYRSIRNNVAIYENKSSDSKIVGYLNKEETIKVITLEEYSSQEKTSGNWLEIDSSNGLSGWVIGSILDLYNTVVINNDPFF